MKPYDRPYCTVVCATWRLALAVTVLSTLLSGCAPIE